MQAPSTSPSPGQPTLLVAPRQQYNTGLLCAVVVPAIIYAAWLYTRLSITGSNFWDSAIGVLLGIYICSRPVGNLMDALYTQKFRWKEVRQRAGMIWLVMNFVTTFVGWATIVLGATRMVRPD